MKKTLDLHIPDATRSHWERIKFQKRIGTAVPVFSLRYKARLDLGIGDLGDLRLLVETCADHHLDVIQLLPMNETAPDDNSPFGAISAFALNPIYADLEHLFSTHHHLSLATLISQDPELNKLQANIKEQKRVNYPRVRELKHKLFLRSFHTFQASTDNQSQKQAFDAFCEKNKFWLKSYSLFKFLKNKHHWYGIKDWPDSDKIFSSKLFAHYHRTHATELDLHAYIQWILFDQFQAVHHYANAKHILLKGDIPLLVSKESADVWQYPEYFNTDLKAGAPPDFYCQEGQDWGLPVYNWETLEQNDYIWWKKRLKYTENFYDLYRIDHVLGLFRIWVIPEGQPSTQGSFLPPNKTEWEAHGKKLLTLLLENSHMLPIAEDLGVVPPIVRTVLSQLGIPGYKVMIMEHHKPTEVFSPISLITTSTHDSATLLGLWNNLPSHEKTNFLLTLGIPADLQDIKTGLHEPLMQKLLLQTPASFIILPLQDILGYIPGLIGMNPEQDRINTPGTVGEHNWAYRFPLLDSPEVTGKLQHFIPLITAAKDAFLNWVLPPKPTLHTSRIKHDQLKKHDVHTVKNRHIFISSENAGMARMIIQHDHSQQPQILDMALAKYDYHEYGLSYIIPDSISQIKITFYWRTGHDSYEWEGRDYLIKVI